MTVSAVTIPTPPNSNMDRAMFVWCGTAGSAGDPMATDAKMNSLLSFCSSNGVNVLFLDIWGYLGGGNWSTAHADTVAKFIHFAHGSGIRVMALAGNTDWAHNQQWVANNIVRHIANYNAYCCLTTVNVEAQFDGVMLDVEYWTVGGYDATVEVPGLCELMKSMKKVLNIPVGCFTTQWLALDGTAQTVSYNGISQLEGLHLVDAADHVAVACYNNTGSTQIAMMQPWMDYASGSVGKCGLWCGSETGTGLGNQSYNGGTKATMETQHTLISAQFAVTGSMNWRGQCIDAYASYSTMS